MKAIERDGLPRPAVVMNGWIVQLRSGLSVADTDGIKGYDFYLSTGAEL